MAVGQWHGGKLVLLWAGVACAFLLARAADSDAMAVLFLLVAVSTVVVTWKWLSARETRARRPVGGAPEGALPSATATATAATQVTLLYGLATALDPKSKDLVASMLAATKVPESKFRIELLALQVQAAQYAIFEGRSSDGQTVQQLLDGVYDLVRREPGLVKQGDELVEFVRDRGKGYVGALSMMKSNEAMFWLPEGAQMLPFNGQPPHDVGVLFGFYCGTSDALMCVFGATAFVSAQQAVKAVLV